MPEVPRTPLERQVDALRASAPDCLLLVEVGYKFIAFAEDAHTAAAALGLSAFRSRSVTTAVFPTTRLEVHAHRLLCAGHRVAIALQSETAAERRDGADPRAATFARHLVGAWTLATWTCAPDASGSVSASRAAAGDHNAAPAELTEDGAWASPRVAPRVLLVVHESGGGGGGGGGGGAARKPPAHARLISLLAIDVVAGTVASHSLRFDGDDRSELLLCLDALSPIELLLPPRAALAEPTRRAIAAWCASTPHPDAAGGAAPGSAPSCGWPRVEHASAAAFAAAAAARTLFHSGDGTSAAEEQVEAQAGAQAEAGPEAEALHTLEEGIACCVGAACGPLGRAVPTSCHCCAPSRATVASRRGRAPRLSVWAHACCATCTCSPPPAAAPPPPAHPPPLVRPNSR